MFVRGKLNNLNDFFRSSAERTEKCVYFYRINGYNGDVDNLIRKYYEAALKCGAVIEGNIPNPDEKNLAYYNEMMGMDFRRDKAFIADGLKKWLPRMNEYQIEAVSGSIYKVLDNLAASGKNENMLKNAYIKFMCWLYYKFQQVVGNLGADTVPKILYEANVSKYELMLLDVLCECGCDVVLLQYNGDSDYLKQDPNSTVSTALNLAGLAAFPQGYSVKKIREDLRNQSAPKPAAAAPQPSKPASFTQNFNSALNFTPRSAAEQPAPPPKPAAKPSGMMSNFNSIANSQAHASTAHPVQPSQQTAKSYTNSWIKKQPFDDIKTPVSKRGTESGANYNCFFRINGAEEKNAYINDLYKLQEEVKNSKRNLLIINNTITIPTNDEIAAIRRGNYDSAERMIAALSANINFPSDLSLQKAMTNAFCETMRAEYAKSQNINKETSKAVYLLCWIRRYQSQLFKGRQPDGMSCFIYLGGCKNGNEAAFVKMLVKLPTDVLILVPNLENKCKLEDSLICEINYDESVDLAEYPCSKANMHTSTAAANAARQLDSMMYQSGSGMYRRNQYRKAAARVLETTYDEIAILWNQEMKFRPNFDTDKAEADIPVIFAKVSGVHNKDISNYWCSIKALFTDNTIIVKNTPFVDKNVENPIKKHAPTFLKNRQLQRDAITSHPCYKYGLLREEMQEHIFDKIEMLLDSGLIKGTYQNGMEYTIVAEALNFDQRLLRKMQDFDFTRTNPKIVYIKTDEAPVPVEDSIVIALLNLIGFDIVFFVPTGYRSVENNYTFIPFCEHQIGDYVYDLAIPDFSNVKRSILKDIIFGRGI